MAFQTPDFSQDLASLLKAQNPALMAPGGTPGMPAGVPGIGYGADPALTRSVMTPRGGATIPVNGARVPAPTDDPAVLAPVQKPPDLMFMINPAMTQFSAAQQGYQKADEANRIDPNAVKPRLWERLVGGLLGATQLRNPEQAYGVAAGVTNRRLTGAQQARETAIAPWRQRMESAREGVGTAETATKAAGEQARLNLETERENRERFTAQANADYKSDIADIRKAYDEGRIKDAQAKLDETAEKNKNDAARQNDLLDLKRQMLELQGEKLDKGKDHTAQAASAETQKANAIKAAHAAYAKATQGLPTDPKAQWSEEQLGQLQQAKDAYNQATQDAQDAYEAKAAELGGHPVEHLDVTQEKQAGAPTASKTSGQSEVPNQTAPAGEKPMKTAVDGQGKRVGYFKSTGQWMLMPATQGATKP